MPRLVALLGVFGWLGGMLLFASAIQRAGYPRVVPELVPAPPLVRELNGPRRRGDRHTWVVTRATSAHHMLVVDVDAEHVAESRAIAAQIVQPVLARNYDEVLVYIWQAHADRPFADRRVQWTPKDGYKELILGD